MRRTALLVTFAIALIATAGKLIARFEFWPSPALLFAVSALFLIGARYYAARAEQRLSDILLFCGLWVSIPIFVVELSFLGALLKMPFQDELLRRADAALGFDWSAWAHSAQPYASLADLFYSTHYVQPFAAVIILALTGGDNATFYLRCVFAMLVTTAIASLFPALGPGVIDGYSNPVPAIVEALRSGDRSLPYAGIAWFPSFHTTMAILFTAVYWQRWWAFFPALAINSAMILTIPFSGNHYLTDMIGGALVALLAMRAFSSRTQSADSTRATLTVQPV